MKNYYELLEVDRKASPEIIEKAYKTLAKRYHPDVHEQEKKEWAEENFKKITEAYEVLSNETSRKEYDDKLALSTIDYSEKYKELCKEQALLKQELEALRKKYNTSNISSSHSSNYSSTQNSNNNINNNNDPIFYKKDYNNNYYNSTKETESVPPYIIILNNLGNTLKWILSKIKITFRNLLAFVFTIAFLLFVLFLLLNIPFTRNYLLSFYEENFVIRKIIDIFIK